MSTDGCEDDDVPVFRRVVEDGVENCTEDLGRQTGNSYSVSEETDGVIQVLHAPAVLLIDMRNLVNFRWTSSLRTFWS